MRPIDVSSKEAYFKWVLDWKQAWHKLVKRIVIAKATRALAKTEARGLRENAHLARTREMIEPAVRVNMCACEAAQHEAVRLRVKARKMIELRLKGKRMSWQQKMDAAMAEAMEMNIMHVHDELVEHNQD